MSRAAVIIREQTAPTEAVHPAVQEDSTKAEIEKEAAKAEPPASPEQADAGNYAKGHIHLHGLEISIENAKGSTRSGTDDAGKPWSVVMPSHYGYIKGTQGKDKDHIDVYIGEAPHAFIAYVVNQVTKEGKFDEHKLLLGFKTKEDALAAYDGAFSGDLGPKLRQDVFSVTVPQLKDWLKDGDHKKPFEPLSEAKAVSLKATVLVESLLETTDLGQTVFFSGQRDGNLAPGVSGLIFGATDQAYATQYANPMGLPDAPGKVYTFRVNVRNPKTFALESDEDYRAWTERGVTADSLQAEGYDSGVLTEQGKVVEVALISADQCAGARLVEAADPKGFIDSVAPPNEARYVVRAWTRAEPRTHCYADLSGEPSEKEVLMTQPEAAAASKLIKQKHDMAAAVYVDWFLVGEGLDAKDFILDQPESRWLVKKQDAAGTTYYALLGQWVKEPVFAMQLTQADAEAHAHDLQGKYNLYGQGIQITPVRACDVWEAIDPKDFIAKTKVLYQVRCDARAMNLFPREDAKPYWIYAYEESPGAVEWIADRRLAQAFPERRAALIVRHMQAAGDDSCEMVPALEESEAKDFIMAQAAPETATFTVRVLGQDGRSFWVGTDGKESAKPMLMSYAEAEAALVAVKALDPRRSAIMDYQYAMDTLGESVDPKDFIMGRRVRYYVRSNYAPEGASEPNWLYASHAKFGPTGKAYGMGWSTLGDNYSAEQAAAIVAAQQAEGDASCEMVPRGTDMEPIARVGEASDPKDFIMSVPDERLPGRYVIRLGRNYLTTLASPWIWSGNPAEAVRVGASEAQDIVFKLYQLGYYGGRPDGVVTQQVEAVDPKEFIASIPDKRYVIVNRYTERGQPVVRYYQFPRTEEEGYWTFDKSKASHLTAKEADATVNSWNERRLAKDDAYVVQLVSEALEPGVPNPDPDSPQSARDFILSQPDIPETNDEFTDAYIEAALWASNDESTDNGGVPMDQHYGVDNIDERTLLAMRRDCDRFQRENAADLALADYGHGEYSNAAMAGHDFWLTRNGHGAGFWDRDQLPDDVRERLTAAARAFGEFGLYVAYANADEEGHVLVDEDGEPMYDIERDRIQSYGESAPVKAATLQEGPSAEQFLRTFQPLYVLTFKDEYGDKRYLNFDGRTRNWWKEKESKEQVRTATRFTARAAEAERKISQKWGKELISIEVEPEHIPELKVWKEHLPVFEDTAKDFIMGQPHSTYRIVADGPDGLLYWHQGRLGAEPGSHAYSGWKSTPGTAYGGKEGEWHLQRMMRMCDDHPEFKEFIKNLRLEPVPMQEGVDPRDYILGLDTFNWQVISYRQSDPEKVYYLVFKTKDGWGWSSNQNSAHRFKNYELAKQTADNMSNVLQAGFMTKAVPWRQKRRTEAMDPKEWLLRQPTMRVFIASTRNGYTRYFNNNPVEGASFWQDDIKQAQGMSLARAQKLVQQWKSEDEDSNYEIVYPGSLGEAVDPRQFILDQPDARYYLVLRVDSGFLYFSGNQDPMYIGAWNETPTSMSAMTAAQAKSRMAELTQRLGDNPNRINPTLIPVVEGLDPKDFILTQPPEKVPLKPNTWVYSKKLTHDLGRQVPGEAVQVGTRQDGTPVYWVWFSTLDRSMSGYHDHDDLEPISEAQEPLQCEPRPDPACALMESELQDWKAVYLDEAGIPVAHEKFPQCKYADALVQARYTKATEGYARLWLEHEGAPDPDSDQALLPLGLYYQQLKLPFMGSLPRTYRKPIGVEALPRIDPKDFIARQPDAMYTVLQRKADGTRFWFDGLMFQPDMEKAKPVDYEKAQRIAANRRSDQPRDSFEVVMLPGPAIQLQSEAIDPKDFIEQLPDKRYIVRYDYEGRRGMTQTRYFRWPETPGVTSPWVTTRSEASPMAYEMAEKVIYTWVLPTQQSRTRIIPEGVDPKDFIMDLPTQHGRRSWRVTYYDGMNRYVHDVVTMRGLTAKEAQAAAKQLGLRNWPNMEISVDPIDEALDARTWALRQPAQTALDNFMWDRKDLKAFLRTLGFRVKYARQRKDGSWSMSLAPMEDRPLDWQDEQLVKDELFHWMKDRWGRKMVGGPSGLAHANHYVVDDIDLAVYADQELGDLWVDVRPTGEHSRYYRRIGDSLDPKEFIMGQKSAFDLQQRMKAKNWRCWVTSGGFTDGTWMMSINSPMSDSDTHDAVLWNKEAERAEIDAKTTVMAYLGVPVKDEFYVGGNDEDFLYYFTPPAGEHMAEAVDPREFALAGPDPYYVVAYTFPPNAQYPNGVKQYLHYEGSGYVLTPNIDEGDRFNYGEGRMAILQFIKWAGEEIGGRYSLEPVSTPRVTDEAVDAKDFILGNQPTVFRVGGTDEQGTRRYITTIYRHADGWTSDVTKATLFTQDEADKQVAHLQQAMPKVGNWMKNIAAEPVDNATGREGYWRWQMEGVDPKEFIDQQDQVPYVVVAVGPDPNRVFYYPHWTENAARAEVMSSARAERVKELQYQHKAQFNRAWQDFEYEIRAAPQVAEAVDPREFIEFQPENRWHASVSGREITLYYTLPKGDPKDSYSSWNVTSVRTPPGYLPQELADRMLEWLWRGEALRPVPQAKKYGQNLDNQGRDPSWAHRQAQLAYHWLIQDLAHCGIHRMDDWANRLLGIRESHEAKDYIMGGAEPFVVKVGDNRITVYFKGHEIWTPRYGDPNEPRELLYRQASKLQDELNSVQAMMDPPFDYDFARNPNHPDTVFMAFADWWQKGSTQRSQASQASGPPVAWAGESLDPKDFILRQHTIDPGAEGGIVQADCPKCGRVNVRHKNWPDTDSASKCVRCNAHNCTGLIPQRSFYRVVEGIDPKEFIQQQPEAQFRVEPYTLTEYRAANESPNGYTVTWTGHQIYDQPLPSHWGPKRVRNYCLKLEAFLEHRNMIDPIQLPTKTAEMGKYDYWEVKEHVFFEWWRDQQEHMRSRHGLYYNMAAQVQEALDPKDFILGQPEQPEAPRERFSPTHPGGGIDAPMRVVLKRSYGPDAEWVTRLENMQVGGEYYGHYFNNHAGNDAANYAEALEDFKARCVKLGVDWKQSEIGESVDPKDFILRQPRRDSTADAIKWAYNYLKMHLGSETEFADEVEALKQAKSPQEVHKIVYDRLEGLLTDDDTLLGDLSHLAEGVDPKDFILGQPESPWKVTPWLSYRSYTVEWNHAAYKKANPVYKVPGSWTKVMERAMPEDSSPRELKLVGREVLNYLLKQEPFTPPPGLTSPDEMKRAFREWWLTRFSLERGELYDRINQLRGVQEAVDPRDFILDLPAVKSVAQELGFEVTHEQTVETASDLDKQWMEGSRIKLYMSFRGSIPLAKPVNRYGSEAHRMDALPVDIAYWYTDYGDPENEDHRIRIDTIEGRRVTFHRNSETAAAERLAHKIRVLKYALRGMRTDNPARLSRVLASIGFTVR